MSKYTTELRWVMEQALDDLGLTHEEENWKKCWKVVGLDDYPLYDETHRDELNTKIVRHYYTREIGSETVGRWRMFVREAMHSIMPYYNQLYESEVRVKGIDFMTDHDLNITQAVEGTEKKTETGTETQSAEGTEKRTAEGTEKKTETGTEKKTESGTEKKTETGTEKQTDTGSSKSSSESEQTGHAETTTDVDTTVTGDSWNTSDSTDTNVFSDTPQSMLPDQIRDMKYASNITIDTVHSEAKAGSRNVTDGTTTVTADDTSSASGSGTGSYDNSSNRNTTDDLSRTTSDDLSRTTSDDLSRTTTDDLSKATTDDLNRNTKDDMSRNTTDDLTRHEVGVLSSRANLLKEWRENMLNIDYMVVHDRELRECFMMVW